MLFYFLEEMFVMEVIYHGHSFFEIVTEQGSILIDPFIQGNKNCDVTVDEICEKQILAIAVTHGHHDHVGESVVIAQNKGCTIIAMVELSAWFKKQGISSTTAINLGGTVSLSGGIIKAVRADHSSSTPEGYYAGSALGFIISFGGKKIYHAGDTALYSDMKEYADIGLDIALLPIGDVYTMGVEDAIIAAKYVKAKFVIPMHFNTFPQIQVDVQDFARRVMLDNYGVPKVLKPGQMIVL